MGSFPSWQRVYFSLAPLGSRRASGLPLRSSVRARGQSRVRFSRVASADSVLRRPFVVQARPFSSYVVRMCAFQAGL
eukprot:10848723-Lingulodinium_polyedra.AAC.1